MNVKKLLLSVFSVLLLCGMTAASAADQDGTPPPQSKMKKKMKAGGMREFVKYFNAAEKKELKNIRDTMHNAMRSAKKDEAKMKAAATTAFDAESAVFQKISARFTAEKKDCAEAFKAFLDKREKNRDKQIERMSKPRKEKKGSRKEMTPPPAE